MVFLDVLKYLFNGMLKQFCAVFHTWSWRPICLPVFKLLTVEASLNKRLAGDIHCWSMWFVCVLNFTDIQKVKLKEWWQSMKQNTFLCVRTMVNYLHLKPWRQVGPFCVKYVKERQASIIKVLSLSSRRPGGRTGHQHNFCTWEMAS